MYFHLCCNSFEVYEMIAPIFLTHQRPKSLVFGDVNVLFSISFALLFQEKSLQIFMPMAYQWLSWV